MTSLLERIAALERQVGALGRDSMGTTVLTIGSDGSVSADFSGHVTAAGLDILEVPSGAAGGQNLVAWLDSVPGGNANEGLYGKANTGAKSHELHAGAGFGGSKGNFLSDVVIIDSHGLSDFLQIAGALGVISGLISVSQATLSWADKTQLSNTLTVAHGLGVVPKVVLATSLGAPSGDHVPICNAFSFDATNFNLNGIVLNPAPSPAFNVVVSWLAIG